MNNRLTIACEEAAAVFRKYFPADQKVTTDGPGNLYAPSVLAACVELFDIGDHKDAGQLYLEWLIEHYVGRKVAANIDDVKTIVEALKAESYTEDNPYVFNDLDNRLFHIPHENKFIFCAESQNTRYIYILASLYGDRVLHIRRYYDEYDFDGEKDEWTHRIESEYAENGIREAIAQASLLAKEWSDCVVGCNYPDRPSLQYFKDCNFKPRYGDCRDIGYVLSYTNTLEPRADGAIFRYMDVKMAFFELRGAILEVKTGFDG
jgi:hypothetical protein